MFGGIRVSRTSFVLLNFCIVSLNSEFLTNSRWKEYATLCPYNNFCTTNATKHRTADEEHLRPCCQQCSCDPDCHRYGVCCPDVQHKSHADVDFPCVDLVNDANRHRGINPELGAFDVNFHIVDRCPNSTIASQYKSCLTRSNLSDYIVVTDITNGRIYRNNHCADCNGVEQFTQWDIYTECQDMNEVFFETFEERDLYIVDHCSIIPVPPDALKSSIYRCQPTYVIIEDGCSRSMEVDTDTEAACKQDIPGTNLMFADRKHWGETYLHSYDYFKNIFCYQCADHPHAHADLCLVHPFIDIELKEFRPRVNLIMLLGYQRVSEPKTGRCNTSNVWDPYSESCLKLICPSASIPYLGECKHAITASVGVAFTIAFKLDVPRPISMSQSLGTLEAGIATIFGSSERCGRCSTRISRDGTNSSNLFLFYSLYTKMNCKRDFLLARIERVFKRPIKIKVPDVMYPTVVTLTLYTDIPEELDLITFVKNKPFCQLSQPITTYILENCARVDTRMIPLKAEIEASPELTEKMINHTLCVHDYFTYMESLYTNQGSNQDVIQWCNLWLVLWFLKYMYSL